MSSTTNKLNNLEDIEVGLANLSGITDAVTNYNNMENSISPGAVCCIKSGIWFLIMIIGFPISFCDLYFAYRDDTCVSEPAGKLAINLKDYLLVYGWTFMCIIGVLTIWLCFIDINSFSSNTNNDIYFICTKTFFKNFFDLTNLFLAIFNTFGAIIFWGLMDTSECSNSIYNYVFVSLIIKIVLIVVSVLEKNKNKDN